ncbi:hypothetical protein [Flavivirga spongiicola]|uniref:DUF2812 domain-containing protein n=1 Tax=Flavivirga spongiicola TaxID=421621 RepID=A0ABU7XS14_9FLAO|nr:hypothetical protein [Flavivirga sp. MEBiC05379]MDO5978565.1 hypothetical protein [Flavivirga sp. MEBiC05379]
MNHISKEFSPLQLGETKKVFLKNGSSISTKWRKENEYIIRYKPENYADYYSPYFLFEFENKTLKRMIPYPNKRSFVYMIIIMVGFIYFKEIKPDLYLTLFGFSIVFVFLLQAAVGVAAYKKIRNNVFGKNVTENNQLS